MKVNRLNPIDSGGEPPDDRRMEKRVEQLEADVSAMRGNIATILATCATKADIGELRTDMHKMNAEIKTWTLATVLAIAGTALAALLAMATIFRNTAPTIQASPPVPIIITLPSPAAPAPG